MPAGAGTASRDFVAYTLPALGLRRLIAEARLVGEPFSLKYSVLKGARGDETWRTSASAAGVARTIEFHYSAETHDVAPIERTGIINGRSCVANIPLRVESESGADMPSWRREPCAEDELVLLPPPAYISMKVLLALPYPILPGFTDEISCFGP